MAAARAVLGRCSWGWINAKILNSLGWLNMRQLHMSSVLTLAHKIVTTRKPENIYWIIVLPYAYNTVAATGNVLQA